MEEEKSVHDARIWMLERRIENLRALRAARTNHGPPNSDHRSLATPINLPTDSTHQ